MDRGAWCAIVPGSQRVTERLTLPYKDLVPAESKRLSQKE